MASDWRSRAEPLDAPAPKANWRSRAEPLTAEDLNAQVDAAAAVEAGRRNVEAEQAMEARRQAAADAYRPVGPQGLGKTIAHKGLQGATAGWSDRLLAAIARKHELADPANAHYRMPDGTMRKVESQEQLGDAVRDDERMTLSAMDEQHPVAAPLSQLGGALGMQAAMAAGGLPVFSTPGQITLGALEGVGQTEQNLDTPEGLLEAGVRGTGNAALAGVTGRMGSRGGRKLAEAEGTIDRLLAPGRAAAKEETEAAGRKAKDVALKSVLSENADEVASSRKAFDKFNAKTGELAEKAKDKAFNAVSGENEAVLSQIERKRTEIANKIYTKYAQAAQDAGMGPEEAAKLLAASEKEIQEQIDKEWREEFFGTFAQANKAGIRSVRDVVSGTATVKPEHAAAFQGFQKKAQENVDEVFAKGMPEPPVKLTPEQMKAEIAKRLAKANAKGVKAVEKEFGDSPTLDPEIVKRLVEKRLQALQASGVVPKAEKLSMDAIDGEAAKRLETPDWLMRNDRKLAREHFAPRASPPTVAPIAQSEAEDLAAKRLADPDWLVGRDPALARKLAAPPPTDEMLAEGLSTRPKHEMVATIADVLPGGGIKGRLGKRLLKALGSQSDRGAYDAADEVRKSVVMRLLAKYGPAAAGSIRELDSQAADAAVDDLRDAPRQKVKR